jgi:uncharacterized repeat protein (TIGR02059 family)
MFIFQKPVLLLFGILVWSNVSAKTYYVAPSGGSDLYPGTISQPWKTWQKAFNAAEAGDTVFFRGGTYYITNPIRHNPGDGNGHNGTHDNPICFFGYPGDIATGNYPIVDASGNTTTLGTSIIDVYYANNLRFKDFKLKNLQQRVGTQVNSGFSISGDGTFHIENIEVSYIDGYGFWSSAVDTIYFTNCDSHHNADSLTTNYLGEPDYGNKADGFSVLGGGAAMDSSILVVITGCRSWMNSDDAYDVSSSKQIQISNSWAWENGFLTGGGQAFKLASSILYTPSKRRVNNCISTYNAGWGFVNMNFTPEVENPAIGEYFNNISYADLAGFGSINGDWIDSLYPGKTIIRNNIAFGYSGTNQAAFKAGRETNGTPNYVTQDHNTWVQREDVGWVTIVNPEYNVTNDDFISIDTAQLRYPRKADGSLPDITFLKLKEGSDLINRGIDVGLPYSGTAPDLGYSEYLLGSFTIPSPIYLNAVISNNTPGLLAMTYNISLANIIPPISAFTVQVNSIARSITSVSVSGTTVILTLSSPVAFGDLVTVAYTKPPSNPLQTSAGGLAATISAQYVNNNTQLPNINQPPSVIISSPTKSSSFVAPATIVIDAVASDPDGTISKVEFYQGTVKLGERNEVPYSFTWKDVTEDTYYLTAIATDNKNAKTTSATVTIVVETSASAPNQCPIVTVDSPNKGKKNKKHDNIIIEAMASDPDGTIYKVEIKSGGNVLKELTVAPYIYIWKDVDTGTYMITAVATDNLGAKSESAVMQLIVNNYYETNSELINLYPNPNNGHLFVDFLSSFPDQHNSSITIIGSSGRKVYERTIEEDINSTELDISNQSPGIYILMVTSGKKIISTKKFIKN